MQSLNKRNALPHGHPWRIPWGQSGIDSMLMNTLIILAFSLPLEGVSNLVLGGTRTIPFFLSIFALGLTALRLPIVLDALKRSTGLILIILAFGYSITLYYFSPMRTSGEPRLLVQLILMATMFLLLADSPFHRKRLVWAYWSGWLILVLASVYSLVSGNIVFQSLASAPEIIRPEAVFQYGVNYHAFMVGTGIIMSILLAINTNNMLIQIVMIASVSISSLALLMTNSKSATIGLFIIIFLWLLSQRLSGKSRTKTFWRRSFVALGIALSGYYVISETEVGQNLWLSYQNRMETLFEGDYSQRDNLAKVSFDLALDNPLGIGQGNSMAALASHFGVQIDPHNYYLKVLLEAGVGGFSLFAIGLTGVVIRGAKHSLDSGDDYFFWALLYLLIEASIGQTFNFKQIWFFLAMNSITPLLTNNIQMDIQLRKSIL